MHRTLAFASLVALGSISIGACGGIAVYSEDGGSGGNGGQASVAVATNNVATSTSNVATSTTSPSVVSTSTGISDCDTGQPGTFGDFVCDDCVQCAIDGRCAPSYNSCINTQQCLDFADCFGNCGGQPGCFEQCQQNFPNGANLYLEMWVCVVCEQCPVNCDAQNNCGFLNDG